MIKINKEKKILTVEFDDIRTKKITGSRLGSVLGYDEYNDSFVAWSSMVGVPNAGSAPPFLTQGTKMGTKNEHKVIDYLKDNFNVPVLTPDEVFGEGAKFKMNFDFFPKNKYFGGMWDAVSDDGHIIEIKITTNHKWKDDHKKAPMGYLLQVILYQYLYEKEKGLSDGEIYKKIQNKELYCYLVGCFISKDDWNNPDDFTLLKTDDSRIKVHKIIITGGLFTMLSRGVSWYKRHIETGISPEFKIYDKKHLEILETIKRGNSTYILDGNSPINDDIIDYMEMKRKLQEDKKALTEMENDIKEKYREKHKTVGYIYGDVVLQITDSVDGTVIDSEKLKTEFPEVYELCKKQRKPSTRIKLITRTDD